MDQPSLMAIRLIELQDALGGRYGDLSRPQLRLMMKLKEDALTISELATRVRVSSPGVTQMIDKLQLKDYVGRRSLEKDGRMVRVFLTAAGRSALCAAEAAFDERVETLLRPLNDDERRHLTELLSRMAWTTIKGE